MKTKLIVASLAIMAIMAMIIGCSAVTPAPEVKIVNITPSLIPNGQDSAQFAITFRNYNKVDAIINMQQSYYSGPIPPYHVAPTASRMSFYIPGNTDSVTMNLTVTGLNNTRALIGSPGSCVFRFWGADAFGYNKTFSDSTSFGF